MKRHVIAGMLGLALAGCAQERTAQTKSGSGPGPVGTMNDLAPIHQAINKGPTTEAGPGTAVADANVSRVIPVPTAAVASHPVPGTNPNSAPTPTATPAATASAAAPAEPIASVPTAAGAVPPDFPQLNNEPQTVTPEPSVPTSGLAGAGALEKPADPASTAETASTAPTPGPIQSEPSAPVAQGGADPRLGPDPSIASKPLSGSPAGTVREPEITASATPADPGGPAASPGEASGRPLDEPLPALPPEVSETSAAPLPSSSAPPVQLDPGPAPAPVPPPIAPLNDPGAPTPPAGENPVNPRAAELTPAPGAGPVPAPENLPTSPTTPPAAVDGGPGASLAPLPPADGAQVAPPGPAASPAPAPASLQPRVSSADLLLGPDPNVAPKIDTPESIAASRARAKAAKPAKASGTAPEGTAVAPTGPTNASASAAGAPPAAAAPVGAAAASAEPPASNSLPAPVPAPAPDPAGSSDRGVAPLPEPPPALPPVQAQPSPGPDAGAALPPPGPSSASTSSIPPPGELAPQVLAALESLPPPVPGSSPPTTQHATVARDAEPEAARDAAIVQTAATTTTGSSAGPDPTALRSTVNTPTPKAAGGVAARVGNDVITTQEIRAVRQELIRKNPRYSELSTKEKNMHIEQILDDMINRMVVVNEFKKKVGKKMDVVLSVEEKAWRSQELPVLLRKFSAANEFDLKQKFKEAGFSYDEKREAFRNEFMFHAYLQQEVLGSTRVSLPEMRDYYNKHLKDFEHPDQVSWREIVIETKNHPDRAAARRKADAVLAQLRRGEDFATLAGTVSEGPNKGQGGIWEKMTAGSYIVPAVNVALGTLPLKQVSPVIEGPSSYHVVRVENRLAAGPTPFDEVQDKIHDAVAYEKHGAAVKACIQKLRSKTVVDIVLYPQPKARVKRKAVAKSSTQPH